MAWQFVRGWDWRWWTIWQSSRQQSRQTKTYIIVCFQPNFQGEPAVNGSTAGRYRHFQLGQTLSAHKMWRPRKACMLVPVRTKEKKPWGQLKIPAMARLPQNQPVQKDCKGILELQDARLSQDCLRRPFPEFFCQDDKKIRGCYSHGFEWPTYSSQW